MRPSRRQGSSLRGTIEALVDTHYRDRAALSRIRDLSHVARVTAALIHEVQRERGLSSGFVAGAGARFESDLPGQQGKTDDACVVAEDAWSTSPPESPRLAAAIAEARRALTERAALRRDVASRALTPNAVVHQFSQLLDRLLVVIAEIPGGSPHPQINLALIALFNFLLAKEYTGQVRALGSAVCAQGAFEPFQAEQFQTLLLRREDALSTFTRHAGRDEVQRWAERLSDEAFLHWARLRSGLEEARHTEGALPDAGDWYRWSTAVIDAMRSFEISLLDGLEDLSLLILADTRSAWEDSQENPDDRERTLLLRLERARLRLWEQRVVERRGEALEADPADALLEASSASRDEAQRWRRDLDRWDAVVRDALDRARQAQILCLDAQIEAMQRSDLARGANELAEGLRHMAEAMDARLSSLKAAADRTLAAQEEWHLRAVTWQKARLQEDKECRD